MSETTETALIASVLFGFWVVATAVGLVAGALVSGRQRRPVLVILGAVLGSIGSSVWPITMGLRDCWGDAGHWGIVTASLAAIGGFVGSRAGANVGRGIVAAFLVGVRSGGLIGVVVGACFAGFMIAINEGHPIAVIYSPAIVLVAGAVGAGYGILFSSLFAVSWSMLHRPSGGASANNARPQGESPSA